MKTQRDKEKYEENNRPNIYLIRVLDWDNREIRDDVITNGIIFKYFRLQKNWDLSPQTIKRPTKW